ncbi:MAG TPA: DUF433 domain-containing protein [Chloroflexi bacterium]|nr:DUF433 domain-containing protein [Chloroflexota bacterium]
MNTSTIVQATYENGVLRPAHPLDLAEQQVVQVQLDIQTTTDHPHITCTPGICGGRPAVRGTRIPVKVLVKYHQMGYTLAEILSGHTGLTPAQLHDALSYYYDHQAEIEADIEADELTVLLDHFDLEIDEASVFHSAQRHSHR